MRAGITDPASGVRLVGRRNLTPGQWHALYDIVSQLRAATGAGRIVGHRDLDPGKTRPNFDVAEWRADVLAAEAAR